MPLWTFVYKILCRHVFISLEIVELLDHSSVQSLSHVRLCDPMDCRMPGFPAHYQFPQFTQNSCPLSWWCHPTISSSCPLLLLPSIFPSIRSFQMSQLFTSGGQNTGISVSTSVLPVNIQDWSPLGWTGWISLQSKGLSMNHIIILIFTFLSNCFQTKKWPHRFTFLPAINRDPVFLHSWQTFSLFDYSYTAECEMVSYCGFNLSFSDDHCWWASFYVLFSHLCVFFCRNVCSDLLDYFYIEF